jgi:hypothetical protein
MPVPERYRRLFIPELEPGEELRAAANADLWLRYRRLALTDRRILVVERGGVRRPWRRRAVTALPLDAVRSYHVRGGRVQSEVRFELEDGRRYGYALPAISRGTGPFLAAVRRALAGRERA